MNVLGTGGDKTDKPDDGKRLENPNADDATLSHPHMEHAHAEKDETAEEMGESIEHGSELDHLTGGHGLPEPLVIAVQTPRIVAMGL